MTIMSDFTITSNTGVSGVALITPNNEDAFEYLVQECDFHVMANGCAPVDAEIVGDFISDASCAYLDVEYL